MRSKSVMIKSLLKLPFIALFLCLSCTVFGQKKNAVGLDFTSELAKYNNLRLGLGLTYERKLSTHLAIETGLFYRTTKTDYEIEVTSSENSGVNAGTTEDYHSQIMAKYISLPILFKYYTNIINISIGPNFDYFFDWRESDASPNFETVHYSISPKLNYGFQFKVGKQINFGEKYAIEPELRYSQMLDVNTHYLGLGIAGKYRF